MDEKEDYGFVDVSVDVKLTKRGFQELLKVLKPLILLSAEDGT